ncbi:MAG: response regulator [Tissierellaceae bacterium]
MLRAIIADDEEVIRKGLKKLIESYDLDLSVIATARDGEEALALIGEYLPEIILMDINMPFINGLDVIEKTKKIDPNAKIIVISGYDQFQYAQRALELGVFNYLLKPIDYRNFKDILQKAIDSYKKRLWEINRLKDEDGDYPSCRDIGNQAILYIKENFTDNDLSLKNIAEKLHISQPYLTKIIKEKVGTNFTDYLNKLRIEMSIKLLLDKKHYRTINEISDMVGYSTQHYFSRAFKNYMGVSPNQYRNNQAK